MMAFDLAIPNHRVLSSLLLALFTWYPCYSNILPLSGKFILCVPQIPASLLTVQPLSLSTKHISSWHSLSPLSFCKRLALGYSPGSNSPGLSTRDDLTQTAAAGASLACSRFYVRNQHYLSGFLLGRFIEHLMITHSIFLFLIRYLVD